MQEQQQNKNNAETIRRETTTNTFSKYCEGKGNTKEFDIKYTHIIQGPYNVQQEKKLLHIL
jgi:hypothetical protein